MTSYWEKRFIQEERERLMREAEYIKRLDHSLKEVSKSVEEETRRWYKRYADDNAITEDVANETLSKQERRNWKMSLDEYRAKAIKGGYSNELNKEYFKSRISRQEQFKAQLYFDLVERANNNDVMLHDYLSEEYRNSYLRSVYDLTGGSLTTGFDMMNVRAVEIAIKRDWSGSNYSKRVWKNYTKVLPERLDKVMSNAISGGWGIDRTVKEMMSGVDKNLKSRMTTLVQTESKHLTEQAKIKGYEETDTEEYEWSATLESHTCELCGDLDGKRWKVDDPNKKMPIDDSHPNCRCTTIPVVPGFKDGKKWMRDSNGKGKLIDKISFNEWKERYT